MLNTIIHDAPNGVMPLVILHGLFGSAKNWGSIARALSAERKVVVVDLRNHGESFQDADMRYDVMAADVAEVICALGEPVDLLGHSMGGKVAMRVAEREQGVILRRLIVADIAPVAYTHSHLDLIEAMKSLDLNRINRRSEADQALAEKVSDRGIRAFLLQSLDLPNKRWRLGLDNLAAAMSDIVGYPEEAGRYEGDVLLLRGGASDYVLREHRTATQARFPNARVKTLEGAGHWLHAEAPEKFVEMVRDELNRP